MIRRIDELILSIIVIEVRSSVMNPVVSIVMATVNAPYSVSVTPAQLAERIADPQSARSCDCAAFAFLSDVAPQLQIAFIEQMGVDPDRVRLVAQAYSAMAGYKLALAA